MRGRSIVLESEDLVHRHGGLWRVIEAAWRRLGSGKRERKIEEGKGLYRGRVPWRGG
jgi:hypothetical protein